MVTRSNPLVDVILEKSRDAIIACDGTATITVWNVRARELMGPPPEELAPGHVLLRALKGETVERIPIPGGSGAGAGDDLEGNAEPLYEGGEIIGAVAIVRDVAEERRALGAEEALRRESIVRASLERAQWRSSFSTAITSAASASLNTNQIFRAVAEIAVPQFADWCAVDVRADGSFRRVAAAHTDPTKSELLLEIARRFPPEPEHPISRATRTGRAEFMPEIAGVVLEALAHNAEHLGLLGRVGMLSCIVAPMKTPSAIIGAISFVLTNSSRRFSEADLWLAEEIAARIALAAENARLFGVTQRQKADLQLLLESTGEGIYGLDEAGECTFINGSGASILAYAPAELIGSNMHAVIHHTKPNGDPYPGAECPIYKAFVERRGCRVDDELFFRRDGSAVEVEYSSYPIIEDGMIRGVVVTFGDISARKRAEAALRESEARYRGLFDHVSEGVYQTSPSGELLAANPALVRMLGYHNQEALRAMDVADIYVDRRDRVEKTSQLEREGRLVDVVLILKRKDGSHIRVVENARAVRDARGGVIYYEGTLRPETPDEIDRHPLVPQG